MKRKCLCVLAGSLTAATGCKNADPIPPDVALPAALLEVARAEQTCYPLLNRYLEIHELGSFDCLNVRWLRGVQGRAPGYRFRLELRDSGRRFRYVAIPATATPASEIFFSGETGRITKSLPIQ